eukprot:CAMPEP_0177652202 /NCGR_PEP_ID=MMETSP0447-20121125/12985_1 /TAXON_ID=0 /ORGANISM="Stygamoeba regulata, Strain BSH-02190019" /LENGTH=724 /DNA_ID=CAMNT_0019155393 /DNA_START=274 /DNA_END=2448 /DNA_ORIENTATION=+
MVCAQQTLTVGVSLPGVGEEFEAGVRWDAAFFEDAVGEYGGIPLGESGTAQLVVDVQRYAPFDFENLRTLYESWLAAGLRIFVGPLTTDENTFVATLLYDFEQRTGEAVLLFTFFANGESLFDCPLLDWEQQYPCQGPGLRRFGFVWAILPPAADEIDALLAPYLREEVRTLALVVRDRLFDRDLVARAVVAAKDYDIEVVQVEYMPETNDTVATARDALQRTRDLQPDLLIENGFDCTDARDALEQLDYLPPGVAQSICGLSVTPDIDQRYWVTGKIWDQRLSGSSYVENPARFPAFFYDGPERPAPEIYVERLSAFVGVDFQVSSASALLGSELQVLLNAAFRARTIDVAVLNQYLGQTLFTGVWGKVQYGPTGKMEGRSCSGIAIQVDRAYTEQIVEPVNTRTANLVFPAPGWGQRVNQQQYMSEGSEIAMAVVAGVCVLVSVLVLLAIALKWNHDVWVSAQRVFCVVILAGSVMVYASTYLWTLYATTATCTSMVWLLTLGSLLVVATLLAKTWRVLRVFINRKLREVKITNLYLAGVVLALLAPALILLVVWTAMGGLEAELVEISQDDLSQNYYECYADTKAKVFIALLLVYGGLLLLSGAVAAFMVRRVEYLLYNESKFIAASIYTVLIVGVILVALQASGAVSREALYLLRTALILGCMLLVVLFMFAAKIYYVASGKNRNALARQTTITSSGTSLSTRRPLSQAQETTSSPTTSV